MLAVKTEMVEAGKRDQFEAGALRNVERNVRTILPQRLAGQFLLLDFGGSGRKGENRLVPPKFLNKLAESTVTQPRRGAGNQQWVLSSQRNACVYSSCHNGKVDCGGRRALPVKGCPSLIWCKKGAEEMVRLHGEFSQFSYGTSFSNVRLY
jgi:hypothetical protein